jgi:uncharacterized protein (TIGR02145 family)
VYQKFMVYVNNLSDTLKKRNASDLIEYKTQIIDPRDNQIYKAIKLKGINKLWIIDQLNFKNSISNEDLEKSNSNQEIKFVPVIDDYFKKFNVKSGYYYNENNFSKYIPKGLRIYNKLDLEILDKFFKNNNLNNSDLFISAPPIRYGSTVISYNCLGANPLGLSLLPISPLYVFADGFGSNCIDQRSTNNEDLIAIPLADYKQVEVENEEKKVMVQGLEKSGDYQGAKNIRDYVPDSTIQNVGEIAYVKVTARKSNKLDNFITTYDSSKLFDLIQSFFKKNKYDPDFEIRVLQKFNNSYRNSSGLIFSVEDMPKAGGLTHFFYPIRLVKDLDSPQFNTDTLSDSKNNNQLGSPKAYDEVIYTGTSSNDYSIKFILAEGYDLANSFVITNHNSSDSKKYIRVPDYEKILGEQLFYQDYDNNKTYLILKLKPGMEILPKQLYGTFYHDHKSENFTLNIKK